MFAPASECLQEFAQAVRVNDNSEVNLAELVRAAAAKQPDKPAFLYGDTSISFAEFDRGVDRVAAALQARGTAPGDRVALAMHNLPAFPFAYFGILRAGAVAVPLNVMLTETEVQQILVDAAPKVLLGAPPFVDVARRAAASVEGVEHVLPVEEWDELGEASPVEAPGHDDALAVLAYTSGTTGEPKGAMLSHGNLLGNLRQQMELPEHVTENDVLFLALPFFHIFGLNVTLGLLAMNGATGVVVDRFDPVETLRLIERHRITVLFGAPPMYTAWLNVDDPKQYDLSSVRIAVSGAAPLQAEVLRRFKETFGLDIFEGYGLTETAPTLTSNRVADKPRAGSVGKPLPGIQVRLVDEAGRDVDLGDPGELVVRGPNVFQGYWRRDEETKRAFLDGWFRTGDIAVQDEDDYYYLVDRKRDLIIVSGFNVFPAEVENALLQHPKVEDAAVVGVHHPYSGEAVKAFVVLKPDAQADERELIDDMKNRLARFKRPSSIELVDELPHLLTGKVLRRALRT